MRALEYLVSYPVSLSPGLYEQRVIPPPITCPPLYARTSLCLPQVGQADWLSGDATLARVPASQRRRPAPPGVLLLLMPSSPAPRGSVRASSHGFTNVLGEQFAERTESQQATKTSDLLSQEGKFHAGSVVTDRHSPMSSGGNFDAARLSPGQAVEFLSGEEMSD